MPSAGNYLYGFTDRGFQPAADLRGLADAPVRVLAFGDVAAIVSPHPVQRLMPSRRNLEPHHRIVRRICSEAPLVPAAFGHISSTDDEILGVLRGNYEDIRQEVARLAHKCEMDVKLSWNVDNIFDFLVRVDRDLKALRDRVFRDREPSMNDKLQVGSMFEATLNLYRERLTRRLLDAVGSVVADTVAKPPRQEKSICDAALLVERSRVAEFESALRRAATLFDASYSLAYSGPWPPYSFVRLRLHAETPLAVA
jgi:hypothetical protein